MERSRGPFLSLLLMIIHVLLSSGYTIQVDNTKRGAAIHYRSKSESRQRRLSSSVKGKGSKKSNNFWYRGFYSRSTKKTSQSSSISQSNGRVSCERPAAQLFCSLSNFSLHAVAQKTFKYRFCFKERRIAAIAEMVSLCIFMISAEVNFQPHPYLCYISSRL